MFAYYLDRYCTHDSVLLVVEINRSSSGNVCHNNTASGSGCDTVVVLVATAVVVLVVTAVDALTMALVAKVIEMVTVFQCFTSGL